MPQSILPARTDVTLALMLAELLAMLSRPDFRKQVRVAAMGYRPCKKFAF